MVRSVSSFTSLALLAYVSLNLFGSVDAAPPAHVSKVARAVKDITQLKHIILFMQENRSFDHYFGTLAGVRGFGDPNIKISKDTNKSSFFNPLAGFDNSSAPSPPADVEYLVPWYQNYQGGDANDRYQCALAGSNGWMQNHQAYDNGNNNKWATKNTPYSLGYYKRSDIPLHFALADGWTMADGYAESVITSTNPNRNSWLAGTIGVAEAKQNLGGPALDNSETVGCESGPNGTKFSCYPYQWKTLPEYFEDVGISWQLYQDTDNFDDNPLAWFKTYQDAPASSPLAQRGMSFVGLDKFYSDAAQGNLPQISIIVGPIGLSEHPPYGPLDGAWLQRKVVEAVTQSPNYDSSALIISYDETGGWADHVMANFPSITEAPNEWVPDPYNQSLGMQPVGPGFRVPFYIISPFTRNGGLFSELSAHESQILFLEKWAAAIGKPFTQDSITSWRRQQLSDLTAMFDFSKADTSVPSLPEVRAPAQDAQGDYNGYAVCKAVYGAEQPIVPYTPNVSENWTLESGYKAVRGALSEGHYYVFEQGNKALAYDTKSGITVGNAKPDHSEVTQRFVVHAVSKSPKNLSFYLSPSSQPSQYIAANGKLTTSMENAVQVTFVDAMNGKGYEVQFKGAELPRGFPTKGVMVFSVTY